MNRLKNLIKEIKCDWRGHQVRNIVGYEDCEYCKRRLKKIGARYWLRNYKNYQNPIEEDYIITFFQWLYQRLH